MKFNKVTPYIFCIVVLVVLSGWHAPVKKQFPVVLAYVTAWSDEIPDPRYMTHINYAFGHITDSHDGLRIENPERLKMLVQLKKQKPGLKILLSVGGYGSGGFSEMARSSSNRTAFALACKQAADTLHLDGIDIDWEYPTFGLGGISASPEDTRNFTLLMQELRKVLGEDKLLTLASVAEGLFIDFKQIEPYVDFINIMSYDMNLLPQHHSALFYPGDNKAFSCEKAVRAHTNKGFPAEKLVLGIPFFAKGRNGLPENIPYKVLKEKPEFANIRWNDTTQTPYLTDSTGLVICTFDNARSIAVKCAWLRKTALAGAMYWHLGNDDTLNTLQKAVWNGVMQ